MPDVFVSYAREDAAFVRRLQAALERAGREVWVDVKDILPSAQWMEEIRDGILRSDIFVFVVSPDSVASSVCLAEVAEAVRLAKRLVPVLARATAPGSLPPGLGELNWLPLTGDFDSGVAALLEVLDTDLERVRTHTVLLARASEWESRGRGRSLLLRGAALKDAETWLANQAGRRPPSTPEHAQLILASRRAATRRQRGFGLAGSLIAAALAVLAVVALVQWQRTVAAQHTAIARGLVAQADAARARAPREALQLGLAANQIDPTPLTAASLTESLMASPFRAALTGHQAELTTVAYSPTGDLVLTSSGEQGTLGLLWDVGDRDRPRRVGVIPDDAGAAPVFSAVFSPDGRMIALGGTGKAGIQVWDVGDPAAPKLMGASVSVDEPVTALAWAPNAAVLAAGDMAGAIGLWNVADPEFPVRLDAVRTSHGFLIRSLSYSADGRTLASGDADGAVRLWDVSVPDAPAPPPVAVPLQDSESLAAVAFSPTRPVLVTATQSGAALWDVSDPAEPVQLDRGLPRQADLTSVAMSADGRYLAVGGGNGDVDVWDVGVTGPARRVGAPITGHTRSVVSLTFSPDGRTLVTASGITAQLWDVVDRNVPTRVDTFPTGDLRGAGFGADSALVATGGEQGMALWDRSDPEHLRRFDLPTAAPIDGISSLAVSGDGSTVALGANDGTFRVWDTSDRRAVANMGGPTWAEPDELRTSVAVDLTPDGRTLAVGTLGGLTMWDLTERTAPRRIGLPHGHDLRAVTALAFSADGRVLGTGSADGSVTVWDMGDPLRPRRSETSPVGHTAAISALAFAPDGRSLATASWDRSARLWDLGDPLQPRVIGRPLAGQGVYLRAVAFAPDARTLATAGGDGTVQLWDLTDREGPRRIGSPLSSALGIPAVAFAPDGHTVSTASLDDTVTTWDLRRYEDIRTNPVREACTRAGSSLDKATWDFAAPGVEFVDPCNGR